MSAHKLNQTYLEFFLIIENFRNLKLINHTILLIKAP